MADVTSTLCRVQSEGLRPMFRRIAILAAAMLVLAALAACTAPAAPAASDSEPLLPIVGPVLRPRLLQPRCASARSLGSAMARGGSPRRRGCLPSTGSMPSWWTLCRTPRSTLPLPPAKWTSPTWPRTPPSSFLPTASTCGSCCWKTPRPRRMPSLRAPRLPTWPRSRARPLPTKKARPATCCSTMPCSRTG